MPSTTSNAPTSAAGTLLEERAAWQRRLDASLECLRTLLTPSQQKSKAWRPVPALPQQGASQQLQAIQQQQQQQAGRTNGTSKGASVSSSAAQHASVAASAVATSSRHRLDDASSSPLMPIEGTISVHRRSARRNTRDDMTGAGSLLPSGSATNSDIFRATCLLPVHGTLDNMTSDNVLGAMRSLLATPECRPMWDDMVDESFSVEELDAVTRVTRTIFKLGWPASQRDAITISRTLKEDGTLIDVSTSLPRSPDAPAYLRPAPPYVRSHVNLFAWCLEHSTEKNQAAFKLSVFWSWDLRGAWLGMPVGGLGARLPQMITSLVTHVRNGDAERVPSLLRFGRAVEVTARNFDVSRDFLSVHYQVIIDDEATPLAEKDVRLEWSLPAAEGWDVHIDVQQFAGQGKPEAKWQSKATQVTQSDARSSSTVFSLQHAPDASNEQKGVLVSGIHGEVTIQRIAASQNVRLRVNGDAQEVESVDSPSSDRDDDRQLPSFLPTDDAASISSISLRSEHSSTGPVDDIIRRATTPVNGTRNVSLSATPETLASPSLGLGRAAHDPTQALTSIVRRNYIYFTSLLQEPEQKWKPYSDARGVTITQLDSIDPTLVVYRAEATFVGVTTWDLFAAIGNTGVKATWDKGAEESQLIHDVGDASRVWWTKVRGTWPVSARDSVTIETSYKSQNSVHLFSFSTDDRKMFPALPASQLGTIRTQIDLRGWSIESLSPTTVHVTLIEQSDPKGWTSKSAATPAAMTSAVAGVGDFVIRNGSPPIVTRLLGAKLHQMRYDHEKGTFRVEFGLNNEANTSDDGINVECEIRCDVETWGPSLEMVIDPPPINVSCLRRHKLSPNGSGLWLTIEQPVASLEEEVSKITIRRATTKDRGIVSVNGARIKVDVDELSEDEVAQLKDIKRSKPRRVPLDFVREGPTRPMTGSGPPSTPISRSGTPATEGKKSASITTPSSVRQLEGSDVFSDEKPRQPMTCALDVLFLLRRIHAERSPDPSGNPAGWALVSQRNGLFVRRKLMQSISPTIAVQRSDKVVEGLTAEDLLSVVSTLECRRIWDDKVENASLLESYANGASTGFFTTKASFPFRGRGFFLASLTARSGPHPQQVGNPSKPAVLFHASSSYSEHHSSFAPDKVNPTSLPIGRVLIDGWILETLDPYSSTLNYQIPSTRVTHLFAMDFAGSLPAPVNAMWNSQLARGIVAVEEFVKSRGALPEIRKPPPCFEVRGDERDDDPDLVWTLTDEQGRRPSTLISSLFQPATRKASVLVSIQSRPLQTKIGGEVTTPLALPFPRQPVLSNATLPGNTTSTLRSDDATQVVDLVEHSETGTTQSSVIPRATSTASIRSVGLKSRPSLNRLESKKPEDMILADVEVDLRHYPQGYEVSASSEYFELVSSNTLDEDDNNDASPANAATLVGDGKGEATLKLSNTVIRPTIPLRVAGAASQALPLAVTTFDLPPSAVLAATLDPALRPKKHLVRLSLPTSTFTVAGANALDETDVADAPEWFKQLQAQGAAVRLTIRPFKSTMSDVGGAKGDGLQIPTSEQREADTDSQNVPVYVAGERIPLVHVNKTSAMLQRESEQEQWFAALDRASIASAVPQSNLTFEERLPELLRSPVAVAEELKSDIDVAENEANKTPSANKKQLSTITPSTSAVALHDPITPTPSAHNGTTPTTLTSPESKSNAPLATMSSPTSAASAQIMNILNSYPLSRLGASTAVSTTVANGGLFSRRSNDEATTGASDDKGGSSAQQSEAANDQASGSAAGSGEQSALQAMPGQLIAQTEQLRRRMVDVRFSLSTLVLVALIAFLLGSLVRSLLAPADFILVKDLHPSSGAKHTHSPLNWPQVPNAMHAAAMNEVRKMLIGDRGTDAGATALDVLGDNAIANAHPASNASPGIAWRELKRLVEIRNIFGLHWDLVVAAARR